MPSFPTAEPGKKISLGRFSEAMIWYSIQKKCQRQISRNSISTFSFPFTCQGYSQIQIRLPFRSKALERLHCCLCFPLSFFHVRSREPTSKWPPPLITPVSPSESEELLLRGRPWDAFWKMVETALACADLVKGNRMIFPFLLWRSPLAMYSECSLQTCEKC